MSGAYRSVEYKKKKNHTNTHEDKRRDHYGYADENALKGKGEDVIKERQQRSTSFPT